MYILYMVTECVCECVLLKLMTVVRGIRTFHTHNYYGDVCAGTYTSIHTTRPVFVTRTSLYNILYTYTIYH